MKPKEYVLTHSSDGKSFYRNDVGGPFVYSSKKAAWANARELVARHRDERKAGERTREECDRLADFDVISLEEYNA